MQIILVDDGSPDFSGLICDRNARKDLRIKVIHKKNGGLSSARNAGLDVAIGEYIVFIDADDTIHPQYIEIFLKLCQHYNCDIAQCDYLSLAEDSVRLPLNPQQSLMFYNNRQSLYELCCGRNRNRFVVVWNKIYKKELFDKIRFPLNRIHEDEFVTYLLFWNSKKTVFTNQYLYYYLQRKTSITGRPFTVKRLDALDALRERAVFLKRNKLKEEYIETIRNLFYLIEKDCRLLKENSNDCEDICLHLLEEQKEIKKRIPFIDEENSLGIQNTQIIEKLVFQPNDRIILYGAGKYGRIYYQFIKENNQATIVGWIDNQWHIISNTEYPVMPLDLLLRVSYDYVLIAIQGKDIQKEIVQNLISWGVSEKKIILI